MSTESKDWIQSNYSPPVPHVRAQIDFGLWNCSLPLADVIKHFGCVQTLIIVKFDNKACAPFCSVLVDLDDFVCQIPVVFTQRQQVDVFVDPSR